jgi:hypothetical protein
MLALALLLLTPHITPAQDTVEVKYNQGQTRIVSLVNMAMPQERQECEARIHVGTIVGIQYNDVGVVIEGFGLRVRDGGRFYVGLSESIYQRLANVEISLLDTLIRKGQKVRVKVYRCGASGGLVTADQVSVLSAK